MYHMPGSARVCSKLSVFAGSKTRCFIKLNKYISFFNLDSIYIQTVFQVFMNFLHCFHSSHKNASRTNISILEFPRKGTNWYLSKSGFSLGLVLG